MADETQVTVELDGETFERRGAEWFDLAECEQLHPLPSTSLFVHALDTIAALRAELADVRRALTTINALHNLGDAVYDVRAKECEGWEGPNVVAYGAAHKVVAAFLGRALEGK